MIEIVMTGMCERCTHADLDLQRIDIDTLDGDTHVTQWSVFCDHRYACEEMRRKMEVTE